MFGRKDRVENLVGGTSRLLEIGALRGAGSPGRSLNERTQIQPKNSKFQFQDLLCQ